MHRHSRTLGSGRIARVDSSTSTAALCGGADDRRADAVRWPPRLPAVRERSVAKLARTNVLREFGDRSRSGKDRSTEQSLITLVSTHGRKALLSPHANTTVLRLIPSIVLPGCPQPGAATLARYGRGLTAPPSCRARRRKTTTYSTLCLTNDDAPVREHARLWPVTSTTCVGSLISPAASAGAHVGGTTVFDE